MVATQSFSISRRTHSIIEDYIDITQAACRTWIVGPAFFGLVASVN